MTIAVALGLLALGIFVLVAGRGGGGNADAGVTASATGGPVGTNPAARTGRAMVDGAYDCSAGLGASTPAAGPTAPAVGGDGRLVVPAESGTYQWNGGGGAYTIAPVSFDNQTSIIANVTFTSGPLMGLMVRSFADYPAAGGRIQVTLTVLTGSPMFCSLE
jgi:integrin beta 3